MLKASVYSEVDQMGQEVVPKSNDRKANAAETESMESNDLQQTKIGTNTDGSMRR